MCVFHEIIAAVSIGINVIMKGNSNHKLAGITIVQISEAISSKRDGVDYFLFTQIDLNPAISAIADPARPRTIEPIVDVCRLVDFSMPRDRIFGNGGPRRPVSREGQVLAPIKLLRQAQRW